MRKLLVVLLMFPMVVMGQDAPLECDNNYGECGTPEMSGGGNAGGGGSILIANSDLGDTYQSADDYDDDGVEDSYDNCPRKPNSEQFDSDGDGVGDLCDNCRDTHNLNQWDLDSDGSGDLCDSDMDGDGVENVSDNCLRRWNADQSNVDGDEEGDACERDIDGDGLDNLTDPCPMREGDPTEDTEWCSPDTDGDGVPDYGFSADNCPGVHNPEQWDTDLDGSGDECDPDLDGDGVGNLQDNCNGVFNFEQIDADRDGRGDEGCDDKYCYVVFGDEENCLDPDAGFRVYSPNIAASTGEIVRLRLFMNRKNQENRYTWSVKTRPGGSSATVNSPIGYSYESTTFEYILERQPTFIPDFPGEYVLVLDVEAVFSEGMSDATVQSQHEVRISVSGAPITGASTGCSVSNTRSSGVPFLLGLLFLCVTVIQRCKSGSIASYDNKVI